MKTIKQMNIRRVASLRLSNCNFGNNFSDACLRFLKSAEMLPNDTALGLQIKFAKDTVPNVYVFSDAKLSVKDFEWMFNPCAEVSIHKDNAIIIPNETTTYLISQCSSYCTEKSLGESNLIEELCELGATLNVIVPSKSINAAVTLQTSAEISLRVCVMLSNSFHGAEIKDITASCNEEQKGVPYNVISNSLKYMLSEIAEKSDLANSREIILSGEDESCTMIEELDISVRAYNCLKRTGINTLEQLKKMRKEELIKVRNLGRKTYEEVIKKAEEYEPALQFESEIETENEPIWSVDMKGRRQLM